MRRFAGQYKKQSIYGLGAQVSISAPSRPYFVTAGYLSQLTHGRLADLPRARTAGCLRTAGWRPFHPNIPARRRVRVAVRTRDVTAMPRLAATRLLYFAGSRRLVEQDSSVGLLYVIFATTLAAKPHRARSYIKQAYESSQRAKRLNPRLPAALATNLDTTGHHFDELVSLNSTKSLGLSGWAPRVAALASSPFELTLELDSTAMVCSAELHSVLLVAHRNQSIDFAVNFEASPTFRQQGFRAAA